MSRVKYSRRRDALTAAPQQDTAPLPGTERRAPIRKHLSRMPRRCDALPSTNPVETMAEATGYDLAKSGGWIFHLTTSHRLRSAVLDSRRRIAFGSTVRCGSGGGSRVQIRERRGALPQNVVRIRVGWMRAGDLLWCWECGVVACGGGATLKGQNSSTAVDSAQRPTVHCLHRL